VGSAQDLSTKTMVSRMFDVKFPYGIQLTFGSLIFAVGENGELKILPPGPAPGQADPAKDQIVVQEAISALLRSFRVSRL
jgi:hypothetical protein